MTSRIGNNGFTLIEVLVASVILFAGLGAVLKAYSLAVVAMDAAADKLSVSQIVLQKMGELEVQVTGSTDRSLPVPPSLSGGGAAYLWKIQTDRQILTPEVSVLRAAIEVSRANTQVYTYHCEWAQFQERKRAP